MKNAYLGHGSKIINGMPYNATLTPPSNYYSIFFKNNLKPWFFIKLTTCLIPKGKKEKRKN
jgi:hypothetical protein